MELLQIIALRLLLVSDVCAVTWIFFKMEELDISFGLWSIEQGPIMTKLQISIEFFKLRLQPFFEH